MLSQASVSLVQHLHLLSPKVEDLPAVEALFAALWEQPAKISQVNVKQSKTEPEAASIVLAPDLDLDFVVDISYIN